MLNIKSKLSGMRGDSLAEVLFAVFSAAEVPSVPLPSDFSPWFAAGASLTDIADIHSFKSMLLLLITNCPLRVSSLR